MSYYDHATMMAFRLGPWARKNTTEIEKDIEHAAMRAEIARPKRRPISGAVRRMLELFAQGRVRGACRRAHADGDAPHKT